MKKKIKLFMLSLIMVLASCEKVELTTQEKPTALQRAIQIPYTIDGYGDVKAWSINNGLPSTCEKNILVFKSWNRYHQVIQYLDDQTEQYCDAFDAAQPAGQTDGQYDAVCLSTGFDEDNKLIELENNFTFCSLRKKLNVLEDAWLATLGDGMWDLTNDPNNHLIDDYTERTLLNEGVEVIIGPLDIKLTSYELYKFAPNGDFYTIPLTTTSSTNNTIINTGNITSLQQINNGTYVPGSNESIIFVKADIQTGCRSKIVYEKQYINGTKKFIAESILRPSVGTNCNSNPCTSIFPSKAKAVTRGFKKRSSGSGWKKARTWIVAEVCGVTPGTDANFLVDCISPDKDREIEDRRRRHVDAKISNPSNYISITGYPQRYNIMTNSSNRIYSRHSQENYLIMHDFFNL